jgi:hypothetical protein
MLSFNLGCFSWWHESIPLEIAIALFAGFRGNGIAYPTQVSYSDDPKDYLANLKVWWIDVAFR